MVHITAIGHICEKLELVLQQRGTAFERNIGLKDNSRFILESVANGVSGTDKAIFSFGNLA